ncbi:MAG: hypothetical protein HYT27_00500 [Parcubacteria group bacterium]|nr:hypothetical protein [Parcubacteria group bacterium]
MRKTLLAFMSLSLLALFSSFALANNIEAPNIPAENAVNEILNYEQREPCGVLTIKKLASKTIEEEWVIQTWKDSTHPFIVTRYVVVKNKSVIGVDKEMLEVWVDNNSDGHFDEYVGGEYHMTLPKLLRNYTTPCHAIKK